MTNPARRLLRSGVIGLTLLAACQGSSTAGGGPSTVPSPVVVQQGPPPVTPPVTPPARRMAGITAAADTLNLSVLSKLGVTRVRFTLYWKNYLDSRHFGNDRTTPVDSGGHTPAEFFAMDMAAFRAAGVEPLIVVHTPPAGMDLATGIAAMPAFMAARAREFPGVHWEIMNEMTGADAFNGSWFSAADGTVTDSTRGDRYAQLLGPVYDSIKTADPTATVLTGGIDHGLTAFHSGLVARAAGKFDIFAVHSYGPPAAPGFQAKSIEARGFLVGVPLWCTETGNNQADEQTQASDIQALLDDNDRNNRYDRIYLYTLMGTDGYAVVRGDGTFRQAAQLLPDRRAP